MAPYDGLAKTHGHDYRTAPHNNAHLAPHGAKDIFPPTAGPLNWAPPPADVVSFVSCMGPVRLRSLDVLYWRSDSTKAHTEETGVFGSRALEVKLLA